MPADDARALQAIPLFARLNQKQRGWLSAVIESRDYAAGEDIFVQGQPADGLVMLLAGQALLFQTDPAGGQQPLEAIAAGQPLNQDALFAAARHSATLRATQPSRAVHLRRAQFAALLAERPELQRGLQRAAQSSRRFAGQRDDEEILLDVRRHWWAFLQTAWLPFLLMMAMFAAAVLIESALGTLLVILLAILLPGIALIYFYLEWRNDAVIVSDQRIICTNRVLLSFSRQITEIGLDSVHEINFEIPPYDPFARLFRYGTVEIKTAGSQGNITLELMPNPQQFQKLIIEDRQYIEERQAQRHHARVRSELTRWMAGEAVDADLADGPADADSPPQARRGTNGYLSTRIEMSNGDIVYRKHISVWARHTFIPIGMMLGALLLLVLTFTLLSADLQMAAFAGGLVLLLIGAVAYYYFDWDWRNDYYIISDDTITLIHKRPLFLQNLRDQILVQRIDNVESSSTGLFAALFKYGDVRISLVGADEHKVFHRVSRPREIQQEISRRLHAIDERRSRYEAQHQRQILGEYLAAWGEQTGNASAAAPSPAAPPAAASSPPPVQPAVPLLRAASNPDRNRPPRVPRKIQRA